MSVGDGDAGTGPRAGRSRTGRGASLVAAGILASRVAGLLRELVVAAFLGNGAALDAFTAAFRIPNVLQNLLGEGVLSASFIPSYSRLLAQGRREEAATVASVVLSLLAALTGGLVVVGVVFAEPVATLVAGGFTGARRELTVTLLRIVTPGIGLLVLSAWCLGILNSHRRFFLSYVAPVLWNLAQIVVLLGAAWLSVESLDGAGSGDGISAGARELALALGWGTLIGSALQLGVQIPSVRRLEPGLRPTLRVDDATRGVLRRFLPVVGARGVVQLSAFLDVLLGSFLVVGAVAALRYASFLYLLPISVFGMSIAAAELPELSAAAVAPERRRQLRDRAAALLPRVRTGLARLAYFVVPTAALFIAAGDVVVGALLQRGQFDRLATLQVWVVLAAYAVGLVPATASRLLQSASYGLLDTRSPAQASVLRVTASTVLGVLLMFQLDRVGVTADGLRVLGDLPALGPLDEATRAAGGVPRLGAAGLAIGAGTAAWVEFAILRRRLRGALGPIQLGGGVLEIAASGALAAIGVSVLVRVVAGSLPPLLLAPVMLLPSTTAYLWVTKQLGFPLARAIAGGAPTPRRSTRGGRPPGGRAPRR